MRSSPPEITAKSMLIAARAGMLLRLEPTPAKKNMYKVRTKLMGKAWPLSTASVNLPERPSTLVVNGWPPQETRGAPPRGRDLAGSKKPRR
jgi:hypothetical protein